MATYYVRPGGSDSNSGTGPAVNQAWQTIGKALSASGISSGDTVYIAPGAYNESITIGMTSATATTSIIGDPSASQFTGVTAGPVMLTAYTHAGAVSSTVLITGTTKNYLSFENIYFDGGTVTLTTSTNMTFNNCQFAMGYVNAPPFVAILTLSSPTSTAINATITKCSFFGGEQSLIFLGQNVADTSSVTDSIFMAARIGINTSNLQLSVFNCTFFGIRQNPAFANTGGSASFLSQVTNCLFWNCLTAIQSDTGNRVVQTYNRFIGNGTNLTFVSTSVTSTTTFSHGLVLPYYLQNGLGIFQMFTPILGGPNTSAGIATGAPASDMYGVTWTGATPDTGSATYRNLSTVSPYVPTERNASTITIAPGSTSQSIELYLGATGLTASTSGLSARYNRTRTASVDIQLVARTIAQAWTAGGFAEVDATNMPGVYRVDLPDAALAAGADDVTIVVRGASGTNGAVMTIKLSSGGLTSAQTAAAVWDEARSSHVTAGTFGEYVNAELVTPVTSAALVRMGPYEVKADGLGASDPLDIQKGAQHGVDIQCVDAFGSGIDITSATVTAKVYNSGATLVDTYACTATYAADGRATFTIDTTVTNSPGTYTATITRTTGASDTQVFGPLRIYVRDI